MNLPILWWDSVELMTEGQLMWMIPYIEWKRGEKMAPKKELFFYWMIRDRHRLYLRRAYLRMLTEWAVGREEADKIWADQPKLRWI